MLDLDAHLAELFSLLDERWESLAYVDAIDVEVHDRDDASVFLRVNLHSKIAVPPLDAKVMGVSRHPKQTVRSIVQAIHESRQVTTIDPFSGKRRAKNDREVATDGAVLETLRQLFPADVYPGTNAEIVGGKMTHPHSESFALLGDGHHTKHLYFTSDESPADVLAALVAFAPHFADIHRQRPDAAHHVNNHPARGDHVVRYLSAWRRVFARP